MPVSATKVLKFVVYMFAYRIALLITFLTIYIAVPNGIAGFVNIKILNIPVYVFLWVPFVFEIICTIIPAFNHSSSSGRHFRRNAKICSSFDKARLKKYTSSQNMMAFLFFVLWFSFNLDIGILYLTDEIDLEEILLLVSVYCVLDKAFVLFGCPLHHSYFKNRCCCVCRIHNWDFLLVTFPLLFIDNFFAVSIPVLGLVAALQWELLYFLHPERFFDESNCILKCEHCTDKLCALRQRRLKGDKKNILK